MIQGINTPELNRMEYLNRIEEAIEGLIFDNDGQYTMIDYLVREIEEEYRVRASDQEFQTVDDVYNSDNASAKNILDKADLEMEMHLLYGEDDTSFDLLPFRVTRSITDREAELHYYIVKNLLFMELRDILEKQLEEVKENEQKRWENEQKRLEEERLEKERLAKEQDLADKKQYGFLRKRVIEKTKSYIDKVEKTYGKVEKIKIVRELFEFLSGEDGSHIIWASKKFKDVVKRKLIEFRYQEDVEEAERWWFNIFNTRIPSN